MSINEPVFDPSDVTDDPGALLQAVVVQLHQVTERLAVLEDAHAQLPPNLTTRPPARVRHHDPHMQRQTGWQPTVR